ncbi:TPM domain-containing protein [Dysgonomonas alginatilytica]|uniref:TPM domain-containing protein n=1 Tax=Dysgonomonas alginatilytica TaxID=1605892 RepID=UPI001474BC2B|nr:TPM domain-containing protein [Dysgonomonas alginatilytica]
MTLTNDLLIMRRLRICFIFILLLLLCLDGYAAPKKRRAAPAKPVFEWVRDNSKLFTIQQAADLNKAIENLKDSVKILPSIYVVTQNDYSVKSPFFRAFRSSVTDDKWYISESKDYSDDFVILIRPRNKVFAAPQLNILCNRNSTVIAPFITSQKIDRLQSEYNKYLSDAPNSAQSAIIEKLLYSLRSRFFDGSVRDYRNVLSPQDEAEINLLIQSFQDSTTIKVAMITTLNSEGEDSVFGRALLQQKDSDKDKQMAVEFKNLDADLIFVFYPKGVWIFSNIDKEKLSDKALENLINKYALPLNKAGQYKRAMQESLPALSAHFNGDAPLDGMSMWEKIGAMLLGVGIPAAFGWFIFKDSLKKKNKTANHKPVANKPVSEKKPTPTARQNKPAVTQTAVSKPEKKEEKKEENKVHAKPSASPIADVVMKVLPRLVLTKPIESAVDRGWTLDNTGSLPVTMTRIDEVFKPISPRNEHEKMMLEMIDYMRSLREYTNEEIAHSLGSEGVSLYLDELYGIVDPAAVRIVFNRGLDLLIKNYSERDPRVSKYIK